MDILFATSNPYKVREVEQILAPLGIKLSTLDSLDTRPTEPVEDADTFEENARLKAQGYARATGRICLAEDSGLEVPALDGAPGVYSARYAGCTGSRDERDRANNEKLLRAIRELPPEQRAARFVCAMCLCEPGGRVLAESHGSYAGVITEQPAGDQGFGYDPLLYLPDLGCTSAQLSPEEKNARSHRGAAARNMARALESLLSKDAP